MPEEDGGESPEVESGTRSKLECCPEGMRNDVGGDINAISLEERGVGTGLETNRAREDLINTGFNSHVGPSEVCGNHNHVDQMAGSLGKNGLILGRGNNLVGSDEGGNGPGDRSMHEIQNRVLSTKEKQKRDRKEKLEKGKAVARCEDSIVNLSLSDSDINNRHRVIFREAKRTWEVGNKVGLSVRGDEEEVIEEIGRLKANRGKVDGIGGVRDRKRETKLELINIDVVRKLWGMIIVSSGLWQLKVDGLRRI
ncbi:hypothetical protein GOBAR_AA39934 [Gossypium barbadense]|uniref:DUF4283 domain-containing protein n=1 Tax=Gossypium barbadense TaxID=3634 RepID=A0A2P5VPP6_GOSBA|nr:hypothetical protein GOBAR_AA39934 [Gossypium barbadense]